MNILINAKIEYSKVFFGYGQGVNTIYALFGRPANIIRGISPRNRLFSFFYKNIDITTLGRLI